MQKTHLQLFVILFLEIIKNAATFVSILETNKSGNYEQTNYSSIIWHACNKCL